MRDLTIHTLLIAGALAGCAASEPTTPHREATDERFEAAEDAGPATAEPEVIEGKRYKRNGVAVGITMQRRPTEDGRNTFDVRVEVTAREGVIVEGAFETPGSQPVYEPLVAGEVSALMGGTAEGSDIAAGAVRVHLRLTRPDGRVKELVFVKFN